MAEPTLEEQIAGLKSIEDLKKKLIELVKEEKLSLSEIPAILTEHAAKFKLNKENIKEVTDAVKEAAKAIENNLQISLNGVHDIIAEIKTKFEEVSTVIKNKTDNSAMSTGGFVAKLALISPMLLKFGAIPKQFDEIGKAAVNSQSQISSVIDKLPIGELTELTKNLGVPGITAENIKMYATYSDTIRNMQTGMVMAAASTGNLGEMISKLGDDLPTGLDTAAQGYNQMVTTIANVTGLSTEQTATFANRLSTIPGALANINEKGLIAGKEISNLTAVIEVAHGTARDVGSVLDDVAFSMEKFGTSTEGALEFVSRLSGAAEVTKLPIENIRTLVKGAAENMSMLGDNTQGTIDIIGKLGPALRNTGASVGQTTDIIKGMMEGMDKMNTAQKSFLSASTGGPGGLMGAFQIDQMLSEGKTAEVFDKLKTNMMQRLGGPIVTRQQAATDQVSAAQYQKQLMFMTSPAMGGMAKDERSAARLLDAMSKGNVGEFKEGLLPSTAEGKEEQLTRTMEMGQKLQSTGNNWLNQIANNTSEFKGVQGIAANQIIRSGFGDKSKIGIGMNREAENIERQSSQLNPFTGKGEKGGVSPNEYIEDISRRSGNVINNPDSLVSTLSSAASGNRFGTKRTPRGPLSFENVEAESPNPPTAAQRAARTMSQSEVANQAKATENKKSESNVNVTVNAICSTCHKKMMKDEIDHYHDTSVRSNLTGTPSP